MEDRRTALAIVLSIIVVMMYSQSFVTPPPSTPSSTPSLATTTTTLQTGGQELTPGTTNPSQALPNTIAPATQSTVSQTSATPEQIEAAGTVKLATTKLNMELTLMGGRLKKLTLVDYAEKLGTTERFNLVEEEPAYPFPLGLSINTDTDGAVLYSVTALDGIREVSGVYTVDGTDGSITLTGTHPTLGQISKKFHLHRDGYLVGVEAVLANPAPSPVFLEWNHFVSADPARVRQDPWQISLLDGDGDLTRLTPDKVQTGLEDKGVLKWASLGDRYFQTTLLAPDDNTTFAIGRQGNTLSMRMRGGNQSSSFLLYSGPKDQKTLIATGFDLRRTIDLGFFTFLADPLLQLLRLFQSILGNYGLAIILLTILLKIAFYPLTAVSFKSMQKMQEIQPEMERLRARYKDATELNQAVMELYKKKGVNPLGGCLPIIIQIPVFFGLYNALLQSIELRHQPFAMWVTDLSSPEKLMLFGVPVPLMIIVMGLTMIWQQWTTPTAGDPQQKKIMMFMPVIFTGMFIVFPMPAGLVLYWLVNNIMSITQQVYLRNAHGTHPFVATIVASIVLFASGFLAVMVTT